MNAGRAHGATDAARGGIATQQRDTRAFMQEGTVMEFSREAMLASWLSRRRGNWPVEFDTALDHPIYSRVLLIECMRRELRSIAQEAAPSIVPGAAHDHVVRAYRAAAGPDVARRGYWMDTDE